MGEVYKARDTRLDRIVAIKTVEDPLNPVYRSWLALTLWMAGRDEEALREARFGD